MATGSETGDSASIGQVDALCMSHILTDSGMQTPQQFCVLRGIHHTGTMARLPQFRHRGNVLAIAAALFCAFITPPGATCMSTAPPADDALIYNTVRSTNCRIAELQNTIRAKLCSSVYV